MIEDLKHDLTEILDLDSEIFYDHLLQEGKNSWFLLPEEKTRENRITGCQSQVWLKVDTSHKDIFVFTLDSDSMMVKGVGTFVASAFSHCTKEQINKIKFEDFKPLAAKLTYQRQRGLQSMINKIHEVTNAI